MHLAPSARRSRVSPFALAATVGCAFTLTSCSNMEDVNKVNPTRLGVAASFQSITDSVGDTDIDTETTSIDLDGGHRVTEAIEVGALLSWISEEGQDLDLGVGGSVVLVDTDSDTVLFGPKARYYFISEGQLQPWVTIGGGVASIDGSGLAGNFSESGSFIQGGIGASYFASRWVAIETALEFGRASFDDFDRDITALSVGLSVFF